MSDAVRDELRRWARGRLVQLRDQPPPEGPLAAAVGAERRRAAALLLGLRPRGGEDGAGGARTWGELASAPAGEDLLLRAIHVRGLVLGKRLAQPVEFLGM